MADQTPREEAQALYEQMTVVDLQADLGERNLTKTGTKPELVARLLDADFPEAPETGPPADPAVEDGELCVVCWPAGWPTKDTNNASCEHGVWDR